MDDETILDEHGLLRRVPSWPDMTVWCEATGQLRPSSACFKDKATQDREVSTTLEFDLVAAGLEVESTIANFDGFGVVRIEAGFSRSKLRHPQAICRAPTTDDPFHALLIGDKNSKDRKRLAMHAQWVIAVRP